MANSRIIATGSYLPKKLITNKDLEKMVDTTDEWVVSRTGIKQRYIAADNELTSDMAAIAAKNAIDAAGIEASSIDLIIVATTTPDNTFPATAVKLQQKLGIDNVPAFDVQAVCSGFVYALAVANNFIKTNSAKRVLVVGADKMSSIVDWKDRSTCILFGDAAGAVILEATENDNSGILYTKLNSDGKFVDILYTDGGVATDGKAGFVKMQGQEVFKHAVSKLSSSVEEALVSLGLKVSDVDLFVPHQANIRILDSVAKKIGLAKERLFATVAEHGNTSAASIPLALDVAVKQSRIKKGDLLVVSAIGGGLTWATAVVRW